VLVRAALLDAHYGPRASGPPRPLREVLASAGELVRDVRVDEPAVLADLDTPDELARWTRGE
jgi:CTP:molybdopterin cytidylyltransferase MocA